jgi:hypothetical protein
LWRTVGNAAGTPSRLQFGVPDEACSSTSKPVMSDHNTIGAHLPQRRERLCAGGDGDDLDVVVTEKLADAHLLGGIADACGEASRIP